jgi:hypothetical protein
LKLLPLPLLLLNLLGERRRKFLLILQPFKSNKKLFVDSRKKNPGGLPKRKLQKRSG